MHSEREVCRKAMAVIPARGGSKGVVRKNAQLLGDKPLVAHSIEVALAAGNLDRVIVSTDDEEIAEIARAYGAEVPFLRPAALATDTCEIGPVLKDLRERLYAEEGYLPDCQVAMYPTSPFRKVATVRALVGKLLDGCGFVTTVKEVLTGKNGFLIEEEGRLRPLKDCGQSSANRRYSRSIGYLQGTALEFRPGDYVHTVYDEIELIDIDSESDLELAREVVRRNLFDSWS